MPDVTVSSRPLEPCPICEVDVAQPSLQVCVGCEAQILDRILRTPALHAADRLDAEDLLGPTLLAYPAWNAVCGLVEMRAWQARLVASGHLMERRHAQ